jgi:hypothetical protein
MLAAPMHSYEMASFQEPRLTYCSFKLAKLVPMQFCPKKNRCVTCSDPHWFIPVSPSDPRPYIFNPLPVNMWVTAEPSSVNVKPLFFGLLFISTLLLPLVQQKRQGGIRTRCPSNFHTRGRLCPRPRRGKRQGHNK